MPCRDGGFSNEQINDMQRRLDETTRLLCSMIATGATEEHRAWYATHRFGDKKRALAEARNELERRKRKLAQIRDLGGDIGDGLMAELEKLGSKIEQIEKSDPMNTELY